MLRMLKRLIDGDEKLRLAVGQIFAGNADSFASAVAPTGDATLGSAGSIIIGATKVTSAMIAALAVTSAKLDASAVGVTKLKYTKFTISVSGADAAATSAVGSYAMTAGGLLIGIYLQTLASVSQGSLVWKASAGTNSVVVTVMGDNPCTITTPMVFRGVVIEP